MNMRVAKKIARRWVEHPRMPGPTQIARAWARLYRRYGELPSWSRGGKWDPLRPADLAQDREPR